MCPPSSTGMGRKFTTARFADSIVRNSSRRLKPSLADRPACLAISIGPPSSRALICLFLVYELLRGKPPSEGVVAVLSYLGLALLLTLMMFVFGLDLGLIPRQ